MYRDDAMTAERKKSLAFALLYRASDRTLTDDEVMPAHERLIRKVTAAVGGARPDDPFFINSRGTRCSY